MTDKDLGAEAEQRDRWIKLLRAGYMFHQQEVKETENPIIGAESSDCLLYTSPSPRDRTRSRMPSSA